MSGPVDEGRKRDHARKDGGRPAAPAGDHLPPAGPHAKPELTDHDKTPGTGALPSEHHQRNQNEADPGSD